MQQGTIPSYRRVLGGLLMAGIGIIIIVPIALAGAFVALGFNSLSIYLPPIGQVMAFYAQAAEVTAAATAPTVAILAALIAIPRFRRWLWDSFTGHTTEKKAEPEPSAEA